jgi:TM2 domain-containing membrane protein YozV
VKIKFIILLVFLVSSISNAQEVSYGRLKQMYENFEYENVLKYSEQLITSGNLTDSLKINVHLMRAKILYKSENDTASRKSFESILVINKNYTPDQSQISPKLISIFNEVKTEYIRRNPDIVQPGDSTKTIDQFKFTEPLFIKNAIVKNILLPGLGQIQFGQPTKGWITASLFTINLGAMIYSIIDTKSKENAYLNEANELQIQPRYDEYNKAYKTRNVLIISCAAVWLYSQLDFLFGTSQINSEKISSDIKFINQSFTAADFQFKVSIPF